MAQQLALDIRPERLPTLENFVPGRNAELVARLRNLVQPSTFDAIYVWGKPGSGRSHLLEATCRAADQAARRVVRVAAAEVGVDLPCPPGGLLIVDDVDRLDEGAQIALFRVFNAARLAGLALLLSGSAPPRELALREDLRSRIGQTLVYELIPLDDADKSATLASQADQRGLRIDEGVIGYMMRHTQRDLPSLMRLLDELDRASLERKRPITLPLLREVLGKSSRSR